MWSDSPQMGRGKPAGVQLTVAVHKPAGTAQSLGLCLGSVGLEHSGCASLWYSVNSWLPLPAAGLTCQAGFTSQPVWRNPWCFQALYCREESTLEQSRAAGEGWQAPLCLGRLPCQLHLLLNIDSCQMGRA